MKIYKIVKYFLIFSLIGLTLLLEIGSICLSKINIEFSDSLIILKMIMTWFVTPFMLIMLYNNTMVRKLNDNPEMVSAVHLSCGIFIFVLIVLFIARILFFFLFQDRVETPLGNGNVRISYVNFGEFENVHYQYINPFLYKRIN